MHPFEHADERFSCPNCQEALRYDDFPQKCLACRFTVEICLTQEDAVELALELDEDEDTIVRVSHDRHLGWVVAHTVLMLV